MITNLIAVVTITLVTNVSEIHPQLPRPQNNTIPVQTWGGIVTTNTPYIGPFESVWYGTMDDPNHKTVTTTVSQRKLLSFEWAGQLRQIENLEMISTSSRTYTLKTTQEWVEDQGSATMEIPISTNSFYFLFGTNLSASTNLTIKNTVTWEDPRQKTFEGITNNLYRFATELQRLVDFEKTNLPPTLTNIETLRTTLP